MNGGGLLFRNVGPETKALGFSMQSISRLYGPGGQDDELVIDNQGFWFRRSAKSCPNIGRLSISSDERPRRDCYRSCAASALKMPHCSNSSAKVRIVIDPDARTGRAGL
jgi:hypothetical protein